MTLEGTLNRVGMPLTKYAKLKEPWGEIDEEGETAELSDLVRTRLPGLPVTCRLIILVCP